MNISSTDLPDVKELSFKFLLLYLTFGLWISPINLPSFISMSLKITKFPVENFPSARNSGISFHTFADISLAPNHINSVFDFLSRSSLSCPFMSSSMIISVVCFSLPFPDGSSLSHSLTLSLALSHFISVFITISVSLPSTLTYSCLKARIYLLRPQS